MNTDWERIKQVLAEAAARNSPAEREAYLDGACRGDERLRAEVEKLLVAHDQAGAFLEEPVAPPQHSPIALPATVTEKPGDKIGHYKLLQQIGEGGCGVVYMAEQEEPIRRRVALKVIKLGMDTKQVVARFEAERQALALMDHPNIAKVLDAGATDTGRLYFVMELVRGIKLTDYCDENKLSTEERLDLFVQICHAIQHAHQKGVIHRDIKPSNILVTMHDGKPLPKIIDFGIAKATTGQVLTDKTLFTAFEQFIGTPAYMSPEQAEMSTLDIDTRSDVYALGVLLYELLTGQTPFDAQELVAAGLSEMRRIIREQEPLRPSNRLSTLGVEEQTAIAKHRHAEPPKLLGLIRGDLDWIVMKCLEKDRTRRYETANGLAHDILCHLNNEPVLARPPSKLYRFQKLVRRNKLVFGATTAIGAALLLGAVVSTWQAVRAGRAEREQSRLRQQAEEARSNEAKLLTKAEADERKASTEAAKSQQVAQFLEDMLQSVGPSVAMGRDTTILREILDRTATRVGKDLTNQPEVEIELRTILAETYLNLDAPHQAEDMARQALKRALSLHGETNLVTARLLVDIGGARSSLEDPRAALDLTRQGLAIQRQLLPHDHLDIARTIWQLGGIFRRFGPVAKAEAPLREALAIRRKLCGDRDPSLAPMLNDLAFALNGLRRLDEAEALYKEALELEGKDSPDSATTFDRLGKLLASEGRLVESEAMHREAIKIDRKTLGNESQELSWCLLDLGDVLRSQSKLDEAEACYREALTINRKVWADRPEELGINVSRLVNILWRKQRYDEAEQLFAELLTPDRVSQPQSIRLLNSRAEFLVQRGRWQAAAADLRKLVEFEPANDWRYHQLATILAAAGDLESYRQFCQETLARFSTTANPIIAARLAKDCLILPSSGIDPEAVGKLADFAITTGTDPGYLVWWRCTKALADYRRGRFSSAVDWAQKCLDERSFPPINDRSIECYMVQAMAHFQLKQNDQAGVALAKGLEIASQVQTVGRGDVGGDWLDWWVWPDRIIAHALTNEAQALLAVQTGRDRRQRRQFSEAPLKNLGFS